MDDLDKAIELEDDGLHWEAVEWFKRAAEAHGFTERILWGLAYNYQENGDFESAAGYYRQILQADPDHYAATYQMAKALSELERYHEAAKLFQKYLTLPEAGKEDSLAGAARILRQSCLEKITEQSEDLGSVQGKFYPRGKARFSLTGPDAYVGAAQECLRAAVEIRFEFNARRFAELMSEKKVPPQAIEEFADSVFISDDSWADEA